MTEKGEAEWLHTGPSYTAGNREAATVAIARPKINGREKSAFSKKKRNKKTWANGQVHKCWGPMPAHLSAKSPKQITGKENNLKYQI